MPATAEWGGYVVGLGGVAAAVYQSWQGGKAQRRAAAAEEKAIGFNAADRMIDHLQEDNDMLRELLHKERTEHGDELKQLRRQCQENDDRNAAAIGALRRNEERALKRIHELTKSFIGLRTIVIDEAAKEAARDSLTGNVDPELARRVFHELIEAGSLRLDDDFYNEVMQSRDQGA